MRALLVLSMLLFFACDEQNQCEVYCEDEYERCRDQGRPADACAADRVACEQKCVSST